MTSTQNAPTLDIVPPDRPRISPRAWLTLWVATVVVQVALLANHAALDTFLWRSTRWLMGDQERYSWIEYKTGHLAGVDPATQPFYNRMDPPLTRTITDEEGHTRVQARLYSRTQLWWVYFKEIAENISIVFLVVGASVFSVRRWKAGLMVMGGTFAAGGLSALVRIIAGRYRPVAPPLMDGIDRWELFRGFYNTRDLSWPSGHATVAFAAAAVLIYLSLPRYPQARWLFLALASGTALSRVVMLAHFPADVIMAASLGFTVAWLTAAVIDRVVPDPAGKVLSPES